MPELPEVEVVRRGLLPLAGAVVESVEVLDERAITRHPLTDGLVRAADFESRLTGASFGAPDRRGKFLWLPLQGRDEALLVHLGMSGQVLVRDAAADKDRHLRISLHLAPATTVLARDPFPKDDRRSFPKEDRRSFPKDTPHSFPKDASRPYPQQRNAVRLDFVDQRTFGSFAIDPLVRVADGLAPDEADRAETVPFQVSHIARDPLDPAFDDRAFIRRLLTKRTEVKRALLDQTLVSGIGNIYADEALWGARIHPRQPTARLSARSAARLLGEVRLVMERALAEGGTSFDALYVNVNGESGYFSRSLRAYGRAGLPCDRCGTAIVRETFMNRSSHLCPRCQRLR